MLKKSYGMVKIDIYKSKRKNAKHLKTLSFYKIDRDPREEWRFYLLTLKTMMEYSNPNEINAAVAWIDAKHQVHTIKKTQYTGERIKNLMGYIMINSHTQLNSNYMDDPIFQQRFKNYINKDYDRELEL